MAKDNNEQPLYLRVKEMLLEKINKENLKPGDPLPTESELEEMFNVSRTTIRAAINELKSEGLVIKQQGRGTFIANNSYEECVAILQSFTEDASRHGEIVKSAVLCLEIIVPGDEVKNALEIDQGTVLKLQRIRYVDDKPVNITTSYLPQRVYEKLPWKDIDFEESSLYKEMEKAGVDLNYGEEVLEVSIADELQAMLLKITPGFPLFNNSRRIFNRLCQPVEYSTTFTRGDRYRGYVKLKRRING